MLRNIAFADLDGTIIHSAKNCRGETIPGSIKPDGLPGMLMDARHQAFFHMLSGMDIVVPTTARNIELFKRVQLPLLHLGWAILSYGGTILTPDGQIDERWNCIQRPHIDAAAPILHTLIAEARVRFQDKGLELEIIQDGDDCFYIQGKDRSGTSSLLSPVKDWFSFVIPDGWRLHLNGNDLAVLPAYLRKEHAVRWFLDNVAPAERISFGLGDSSIDLGFMRLCDYMITPGGSQIDKSIDY